MSRDNQAGLNGHALAADPPASIAGAEALASVRGSTFDDLLGKAHAAPTPPPKPFTYVSADRIENGFIIRGHTGNFGEDHATRVAHTPAEAGAAVAELLQRHMAAEELKGAPGLAILRFEHARPMPAPAAEQAKPVAAPKAAKAPAKPKPAPAKKPAAKKSSAKA